MTPYFLSNFHPFKCVANTRNTTVLSKDKVEYVKPKKKQQKQIKRLPNLSKNVNVVCSKIYQQNKKV